MRRWESSAAACAAGGLIMLAALVENGERPAAITVAPNDHPPALRAGVPRARSRWEGTLKHGSYHEGKGLGVDESVMWGEYFFVETLARVVRPT